MRVLMSRQSGLEIVGAICALLAGIIPSVYKALGFDISLDAIAKNGHEFKILQDRFRQAARVTSLGAPETFASEFSDLMAKMDSARKSSLTPPERFLVRARKKIHAGHYNFDFDAEQPSHQLFRQ